MPHNGATVGPPPAAEQPIRVLIVDDHEMFAASLAVVLGAEPDLVVVGVAPSGKAAFDLVAATLPDVVLLDQRLPDEDGVHLIGPLLATRADLRVVMVTGAASEQVLVAAIEAGAAGFVDKTRSVGEVVAAVRAAAAGEAVITPSMLARLLPRLRRQERSGIPTLTDREREVLELLAQGHTNAEIADRMSVSVHTVRNHVANMSGKLGAHSKLEVLAIALRMGLLPGV